MTGWFHDGEPIHGLGTDDRGWQFGDGVFETIAVRGRSPRFLDWHLERCLTGCRRLGIDAPPADTLAREIETALSERAEEADYAIVKLVVTAGGSPRGYRRPPDLAARSYVGVFPSAPLPADHYASGVKVRLCNSRLARQPQLAGIKSLNRLEQVLARNEWSDDSVFEGLSFDTEGDLICGTMSNVFIVENSALLTPDLSQAGVAGIMRRKVIETADTSGVSLELTRIDRAQLASADGVFLCNSQFGIVPVRELDGREIELEPLTRQLMQSLRDAGIREIAC